MLLLLLLIHTFSVLSLQLEKLRCVYKHGSGGRRNWRRAVNISRDAELEVKSSCHTHARTQLGLNGFEWFLGVLEQ